MTEHRPEDKNMTLHGGKKILSAGITLVLFLLQTTAGVCDDPIDIGARRELFVDHYLVQEMDNLSLRLHEPVFQNVCFKFDKPWEGPFSGYVTIIRDGDQYRAYYRGSGGGEDGGLQETLSMAVSDDGITWSKPELGLCESHGDKDNNILMNNTRHLLHNFAPFLDSRKDVPAEERYKALAGTVHSGGVFAFSSADGIHWKKMSDTPVLAKPDDYVYAFDSQNVAMWSENEGAYVCYFRAVFGRFQRYIARTTSEDFIHWEKPQVMEVIHAGTTAPFEQFYTNQTGPYFRAPHIYIATPARFMEGRQVLSEAQAKEANVNPNYFKDCSDTVFLSSRGGSVYDRTFMEPLIRPGIGLQNWVSRTNYPACNIVRTGETEMSIYMNANYATPDAELRRYAWRLDGFASLHAPYEGGVFVSKTMRFDGSRLSLNYATSAAGGIRIQLEQPDGTPYPGFALGDCREIIGNEIERIVSWKQGADVSSLSGKPVRLRIEMKDSDVYSFQFQK